MLTFHQYNESDFIAMIDIVKNNANKGRVLENNKKLIFIGKAPIIFHKTTKKVAFLLNKKEV